MTAKETEILREYVPDHAIEQLIQLFKKYSVYLKIVPKRHSKHGDFRPLPDGSHRITVNADLNHYNFLLTLVHEVAHLVTFLRYGHEPKPHGREWKQTFRELMTPFLRPDIFPEKLLRVLARHFKNPRASSDTDSLLRMALNEHNPQNNKTYIYDLPAGSTFAFRNNRKFKKGRKLRKRYECEEIGTGRLYLFQPHVEVEPL